MKPLDYARRNVFLWQNSPVAGQFDDGKYPFVTKFLQSLEDILIRCTVLLGPTQSFKTVALQIATAYRLDMLRASLLAVAQTDDDARQFSTTKLAPFLERIPSLIGSLRKGKYSQTLNMWLWPSHELIISGPGENAQESKSVRFLHTDEAHRWNLNYPGAMAALRNRMGGRWDRHELHVTTAPEAGTEVDILYAKGQQDEWHLRCIHCDKLIWPLWIEESRKEYNGHEVFQWKETQSERETLDSIHVVCPHCHKQMFDDARTRFEMDQGAQYVTKNTEADYSFRSFRWNAFAPRWKSWRDLLSIYLTALQSVKLGDLAPYRDWVTKQLVLTWCNQYPELGDSERGRNYYSADVKPEETELRTMSVDYQAGKGDEGKHWWVLVEQWDKQGNSKRIIYRKVFSWHAVKLMEMEFKVKPENVGVDCGHEPREVFEACSQYHWMAFKSGDEESFAHVFTAVGKESKIINLPYSPQRIESALIGKAAEKKIHIPRGRHVPPGYAITRLWSKPALYQVMFELKRGSTSREYGIAKDINPEFIDQLHSYIPQLETDKKTNVQRKTLWVKIKPNDHAFICATQGLLLAILAGFYPLSTIETPKTL